MALLMNGGGPTAVWNESLAGLALAWTALTRAPLWGARGGVEGWLRGDLVDLASRDDWDRLALQPASALGSSRRPLNEAQFEKLKPFEPVFLSGGNGTMALAARLASAGIRTVGIPKTIDNDIPGCHATPGFSSCANFFAWAARDAGADNRALPSPVMVLETLGRDTGWITAATALARHAGDDAPHLIYLPEKPAPVETICAEVEYTVRRLGRCVVAVCEGLRDANGEPFGAEAWADRDGVKRLSANLGFALAARITRETGLRARAEKPGLAARCASRFVTANDRRLARACGSAAARLALDGASGIMAAPEPVPLPAPGPPRGIDGGCIPLDYLREVVGVEELPPPLAWL
jgi:6-phosphofructokinase 1